MRCRVLFLLPLVLVMASCGARGYWSHRWNDLGDVVSGSVGDGWGIGVRASLLHVGGFAMWNESGLRNGHVFTDQDAFRPAGWVSTIVPIPQDQGWPVLFAVDRVLIETDKRGKGCLVRGYLPLISIGTDPAFYGQVDIGLGCWKAVRFGINPLELVDFVVGFTTVDLFFDDR